MPLLRLEIPHVVPQHGASVNEMNGINYSSFISLGTMNLTPLIKFFLIQYNYVSIYEI